MAIKTNTIKHDQALVLCHLSQHYMFINLFSLSLNNSSRFSTRSFIHVQLLFLYLFLNSQIIELKL